jgi:hypothetical protein
MSQWASGSCLCLGRSVGGVGSVAPDEYAAYAWVLHPALTLVMRSFVRCGRRGHGDGHEL